MFINIKKRVNNVIVYEIVYDNFTRYYVEDSDGNIGTSLLGSKQAIKNYKRNIKNRKKKVRKNGWLFGGRN